MRLCRWDHVQRPEARNRITFLNIPTYIVLFDDMFPELFRFGHVQGIEY